MFNLIKIKVMNEIEKLKMEITPLTKDEEGVLKGGFLSSLELDNASESLSNENCSGNALISNGNCGCSNCSSKKEEKEHLEP